MNRRVVNIVVPTENMVIIRPIEAGDIEDAAAICFEAFEKLNLRVYGRNIDYPTLGHVVALFKMLFARPYHKGIVAVDENNKVIGSNWIDIKDEVATIGPNSVSVKSQSKSVSSKIMRAILDMAKEENFESIRLIQEAGNVASFALYLKSGFDVTEPVTVLEGHINPPYSGPIQIRRITLQDAEESDALHKKIVGISRHFSFCRASEAKHPYNLYVAFSETGEILAVGNVNTISFILAKTEDALHALHSGLSKLFPDEIPTLRIFCRLYPQLARRCLHEWGLRVQRNFTLMTYGKYIPPCTEEGIYAPSLLY